MVLALQVNDYHAQLPQPELRQLTRQLISLFARSTLKTKQQTKRCRAPVTSPSFALPMSSACLQVFLNSPSAPWPHVLTRSCPSAGCTLDVPRLQLCKAPVTLGFCLKPAILLGSFGTIAFSSLRKGWTQGACIAQSSRESGRWNEQLTVPGWEETTERFPLLWDSSCAPISHTCLSTRFGRCVTVSLLFLHPLPSWATQAMWFTCAFLGNSAQALGPIYSRL